MYGPGSIVGIATAYGLDGLGIESRRGARFFAPVQTDPEAHPASCAMGTGSFPGVRCGQGVTLTPHTLLVPRSKVSRAVPLLSLRAFMAYERVKPTYVEHVITYSNFLNTTLLCITFTINAMVCISALLSCSGM